MFAFMNDSNAKFLNPVNNFETIGLSYYLKLILIFFRNSIYFFSVDDNDFFRYLLESITGIATGSDTPPEIKDHRVIIINKKI